MFLKTLLVYFMSLKIYFYEKFEIKKAKGFFLSNLVLQHFKFL